MFLKIVYQKCEDGSLILLLLIGEIKVKFIIYVSSCFSPLFDKSSTMTICDNYIILTYFSSIKNILKDEVKYINHWKFWFDFPNMLYNHKDSDNLNKNVDLKNEICKVECRNCKNSFIKKDTSNMSNLKVFNDFNYSYNETMGILCCHETHEILHINDKKLLNTCSIKDLFLYIDSDKIDTQCIFFKERKCNCNTNEKKHEHDSHNCINTNIDISSKYSDEKEVYCDLCLNKIVR